MLDKELARTISERLDRAEVERIQIRQLSLEYPDMTIADAYLIQQEWVSLKVSRGLSIKGHKIGLTSKAMQAAIQINEPDYGVLLNNMFHMSGAQIAASSLIEPRVEMELAFVLKSDIEGDKATIFDVLDATEYVVPALEILDARIQRVDPPSGTTRKIVDTISDNAANSAIVLGGRPMKPHQVDLRWISGLCFRNGQIEETGVSAGVLNHPATGVAWLAKKLAIHGVGLRAGQVVLAGSFIRPVTARQGDTFFGDFGPWGVVACYFS